MHRNKHIAIILPDSLQSIGLHCLLVDYFPPVEVVCYLSFEAFSAAESDSFDYYFTQPDIYVLNSDFFLPRRNKTIVLVEHCSRKDISSYNTATNNHLCTGSSQETVIEQLQQLFASESNNSPGEGNKELSVRETDVLQLIVKGITNKEIADKLNISLNTVLSHRKNITTKLGIKTVSGLTFYAIMNGFISADDIEL